jgi:hypothetical protein
LEVLASVTRAVETEWEMLDGPDSGVAIDFWCRHRGSGSQAYLNLDQGHPTISVDDKKVYDGTRDSLAWA